MRFTFTKISEKEFDSLSDRKVIKNNKVNFENYFVVIVLNKFSNMYHCLIVSKKKKQLPAMDALKDFRNFIDEGESE